MKLATFGTEEPSLKSSFSKRKNESVSFKYVFSVKSKCILILANLFNLWIIKTFRLFFYKQSKIKLVLKLEC